jgi:hypothetical protein
MPPHKSDFKGIAIVLAAQGSLARATRLWGAAHSLREHIGAPLPANEQETYERQIEQARFVLGKETFTAIWEKGLALTWEQAATYALEEVNGALPSIPD